MNYKIIEDNKELLDFIDWLPDLEQGEMFYLSLLARKKYAPTSGMTNDKNMLKRVTATKDRIFEKIQQMEVEVGAYKFGKEKKPIPQEALALYIHPNPRDLFKAGGKLAKVLVDKIVAGDKGFNPRSLSMDMIQTSPARKIWYDFDLDSPILNHKLLKIALEGSTGIKNIPLVKSRGGYHVLVPLDKISLEKKKTWYQEVENGLKDKIDMKGDLLLPVPGTLQGGHLVKMY